MLTRVICCPPVCESWPRLRLWTTKLHPTFHLHTGKEIIWWTYPLSKTTKWCIVRHYVTFFSICQNTFVSRGSWDIFSRIHTEIPAGWNWHPHYTDSTFYFSLWSAFLFECKPCCQIEKSKWAQRTDVSHIPCTMNKWEDSSIMHRRVQHVYSDKGNCRSVTCFSIQALLELIIAN